MPIDELEEKASELLGKFRELSAAALDHAKRAIDSGHARSLDASLTEVENMYLHELMKTSDATEGVNAFIEKRKPIWRNR